MITNQDLEEWKRDIKLAENTHPNSFANAPFIRSFFKVSQNIDIVGQFIARLTGSAREIDDSLKALNIVIKASNENANKLANKLFWLNVILTAATVIGAVATVMLIFKK
jgi:hypothetical protein